MVWFSIAETRILGDGLQVLQDFDARQAHPPRWPTHLIGGPADKLGLPSGGLRSVRFKFTLDSQSSHCLR